jgi:hypothetical protein
MRSITWISQIISSIVIDLLWGFPKVKRRIRASIGWGILLAIVFIVQLWAYFYQRLDPKRSEFQVANSLLEGTIVQKQNRWTFVRIDLENSSTLLMSGCTFSAACRILCGNPRFNGWW